MTWIFLAIAAHFLWAWVNIGDKFIVSHKVKNPYVYMTWLFNLGILVLLIIPFIDFQIPDLQIFWLLVLGGVLYFFGGFPYIKAMKMEEPTRINVWWNLIPLLTLLLGFIFLGQFPSFGQLVAFFILIFGAVLASLHFREKTIIFSKAVWLMLLACLAYSIYAIIFSYTSRYINFISAFIWVHVFSFLASVVVLFSRPFRRSYCQELKNITANTAAIVVGISFLDHLGIFFSAWALSLGLAALVFSLEGTQVLFVFLISLFLSIFYPHIIKEEIDKKNIILKLAALVLMVVGVAVLYLG